MKIKERRLTSRYRWRVTVESTIALNTDRPTPAKPRAATWEPPGGILVWLVVLLELFTFGSGFIIYAVQARGEAAVFAAGRATLNQPLAFTNTLVLLTGGWCMAVALQWLRSGGKRQALRWMAGAIATGVMFLVLKTIEYSEKIAHDAVFGSDTFLTLYWLLTGFHFLHVVAAIILLSCMWSGIARGRYHAGQCEDVESSGIFWHLCDVLWLLLYPIVYLLS